VYRKSFLGTKGLNIREVGESKYVIEDEFGVCSLPFLVISHDELITKSYKIAKTIPLIGQDNSLFFEVEFDSNYWFELEKYYVARLSDYYRIWQCGRSNYMKYDHLIYFLPVGYSDCGYGEGSRQIFEFLHQQTIKLIKSGKLGFTENLLHIRLMHLQLDRICSDLLSVLQRALYAFKELLSYQRQAIKTQSWAIEQLETNEVIHTGAISYNVATAATVAVISLCTSLDLSSKLIYFINNSKVPIDKFKSAQGKHFSELGNLKENVLTIHELDTIKNIWNGLPSIKSLIQFRHDLIHNTSALELEKLYVGRATEEIRSLPMYYSFQPWRDCDVNGQPIRYLGREYFVSSGVDFEKQLCDWLVDVIKGHLNIGENIFNIISDRADKLNVDVEL
jgi:hypothetical protein